VQAHDFGGLENCGSTRGTSSVPVLAAVGKEESESNQPPMSG